MREFIRKKGIFIGLAVVLLIIIAILFAGNPAFIASNYSVSEKVQIVIHEGTISIHNNNKFRIHSLNFEVCNKSGSQSPIRRYDNLAIKANDTIDIQLEKDDIENLYCKMEYKFGFSVDERKNKNLLQGDMMSFVVE